MVKFLKKRKVSEDMPRERGPERKRAGEKEGGQESGRIRERKRIEGEI